MDQTLLCLHCDKSFISYRNRQKFCCKKCRETHWVIHNRKRLNANVRRYRARRYREDGQWLESGLKARILKEWMIELKSKPCHDCRGRFEICCMDFDHRRDTKKVYNVGSMFAHHYSKELIETEVAKCDLVCANCHRVRTRDRRKRSGKYK